MSETPESLQAEEIPLYPPIEEAPAEPMEPPTVDIPAGPAQQWKEDPPAEQPPAEKLPREEPQEPAPPPPVGPQEPVIPPVDDTAVEPSWPPPDLWSGMEPPQPDISTGKSPSQTVPFLVHDTTGRILRTGYCSRRDLAAQAQIGETVLEGQANDRLQKVVDGHVADKVPEEITPRQEVPPEKQRAFITQEDWDLFQSRFNALDERLKRIEQRQPGITGQL